MIKKIDKSQEDISYDLALEKYLTEGINYGANTIKKADQGDLEQLAADSFFYGWHAAKSHFNIS